MKSPEMQGLIRRRIRTNFRVDPKVMQRQLPSRFDPNSSLAPRVAGICLVRLEQMRPLGFPTIVGLSSENAAHRVAAWWTTQAGEYREGVYIPRRDSDSLANHLVGGRLFPGEHHRASFNVHDEGSAIELSMRSHDGQVSLKLAAKVCDQLSSSSKFGSLEEASTFFEKGALGYSETADRDHLDGLYLATEGWRVAPLEVLSVHSSFFADPSLFPLGSVEFDCALLMRDVRHSWRSVPALPLISARDLAPSPIGA